MAAIFTMPRSALAGAIGEGRLRSVYQPLVELSSRHTVGYEALIRGPEGSEVERPDQLFAAAEREGLRLDLERACVKAAVAGAVLSPPRAGLGLFVNIEPSMIALTGTDHLAELQRICGRGNPVFVELTERDLMSDPLELFRAVDEMRSLGLLIALDDVGVEPESLALIPFIEPDLIKLDMSLTQAAPTTEMAAIFHAVGAEVERSGAAVVAEGIETEQHLERALALGARYGQGWLFGRPQPAPDGASGSAALDGVRQSRKDARALDGDLSPYEIVTAERPVSQGRKHLLLQISREIEEHASQLGAAAVILATFQLGEYFTPRSRRRYERLARQRSFVGVLGGGLGGTPGEGLRGADLRQGEALRGEWDVVVVGPHYGAAFVARDLGDDGEDMDRRFDFAYTHDRDLTVRAATAILRRLAADRVPQAPAASA